MNFRSASQIFMCAFALLVAASNFPVNGQLTFDQNITDKKLAETISKFANRLSEGLVQERLPDGSITMDLQGRFQNVMLGQILDGEPVAACVESLSEANSFFGRNLETGEAVPQMNLHRESKSEIAARHGMSVNEFEFYSKMIADAAYQRSLNPNAATITIVNNDGAGEGFNDPTAKAAEGGNSGATLGAQRLNLFNFAGGIWGAFLDSSVTINVRSQFDPLTPCSTSGGVLGSAGTVNISANFTNAEFTNTWYHAALANKRAGSDLVGANPEINATFNSSVDTGCLGAGTRFYYGLNNTTPALTINLLVVLLHEMGHGLGFSSFVNGTTGVFISGLPDIYTRYMFDTSTSKYWYLMTDAERITSALNTNNVYWDGASVKIATAQYPITAGWDAATGRLQLFTPNPFQSGSSISHYNTAASPNLLMEPVINTGLPIDLDLTRQQMRDIGWYRDTTADLVPDTIGVNGFPGNVVIGSVTNITWANNGGFNRNVTIELSTNAGSTFPTTIASNIANTGTFAWTVPNTPTNMARLRIREHNFAAPAGISTQNFAIAFTPSASSVSIGGRVKDAYGNPVRSASVRLINTDGNSLSAQTNSFGFYRIEGVPSGRDYVLTVRRKDFQFPTRVVNVVEEIADLDIVADQ